jgi:hypothetical protein
VDEADVRGSNFNDLLLLDRRLLGGLRGRGWL